MYFGKPFPLLFHGIYIYIYSISVGQNVYPPIHIDTHTERERTCTFMSSFLASC